MADDFLRSLGQGLQGAGAVLSPDVYEKQAQDRIHVLPNLMRTLEIQKAQRTLAADMKFQEFSAGLQPSAMTSDALLDIAKKIPVDVLSESPRAQQFLQLTSQVSQREAAQQAKKDQLQLRYDQMEQQAEIARQRSEDVQLGIQERAAADKRHLALQAQIAQMRDETSKAGIELRRETAQAKRDKIEEGLLTDHEARFMAGQYLSGDKSVFQNLGRGQQGAENIVKLRRAVHAVAIEKGMKPEEITAKMAEFEGIKAGERTLGTRTANIEMAVTEAQNIIPIALEASKAVDRTKYPNLNALQLAVQKGTGDTNAVRLAAATNALINTYSRAISPTGTPTVHDKEHAREVIDKAYSQGQYEAVIKLMQDEMGAARKSPGQVRETFKDAVTGKEHGAGGNKVLRFDAQGNPLP